MIIDFLNEYFSDNNNEFSIGIDLNKAEKLEIHALFPEIEQIKRKYQKKYNQYYDSNSKLIDIISSVLKSLPKILLHYPKVRSSFKASIAKILENLEDYLLLHFYFDERCYKFFKSIFDQAFIKDPIKLKDILYKHESSFKEKFPIEKKFDHLSIETVIQQYYDILWDKLTIQEALDPLNYNIDEKLMKADKETQWEYLDDWTLKFAQLVEDYYKISLITCGRVFELSKNTLSKDYDDLPNLSTTIADVLWIISHQYHKLLNVDKLRIMRNAIDHGNVKFNLEGVWENYQIHFIERKKQITRTVKDFIIDYFKLMKFIFTLDLICKIYDVMIKYPNKSLSEILIEGYEKLSVMDVEIRKHITIKDYFKMIRRMITNSLYFVKNLR